MPILHPAADILGNIERSTLSAFDDVAAAMREYERLCSGTVKPERRRRERKVTLASVAKQASKAGITVARYEVGPDKIIVVPGKPVEQGSTSTNEWDEVLPNGPASKIH